MYTFFYKIMSELSRNLEEIIDDETYKRTAKNAPDWLEG